VAELSGSQVKKAGKVLRSWDPSQPITPEMEAAWVTLQKFRALHSLPLIKANNGLRSRLETVGIAHPRVSQRLKRMPTIISKLFREPTMQLNTIQDIAGCRQIKAMRLLGRAVFIMRNLPGRNLQWPESFVEQGGQSCWTMSAKSSMPCLLDEHAHPRLRIASGKPKAGGQSATFGRRRQWPLARIFSISSIVEFISAIAAWKGMEVVMSTPAFLRSSTG
jgi:hypothetical protein